MFFTKHVSKMLFLAGIGTATALVYAFFPEWAVTNIAQLPFIASDFVYYQHWGMMVGLMGVMMIISAFRPQWRSSIMFYSFIEKGFMVFLVVSNLDSDLINGFMLPAIMDTIVVIWTLGYWHEQQSILNESKPAE